MRILADPSELRAGSRLPEALRQEAIPCPNLEERTGADLLVSPLRLPPAEAFLRRHSEEGVLIQRKTGGDLASSVTDGRLSRSLERMLAWSPRCWLAVVGRIENQDGRGFLDGRESLSYAALVGALDWWQLRGGYLTILSDDEAFVAWVLRWPDKLKAIRECPDKVLARTPGQALSTDNKLSMVAAVPGIGPERARALLKMGGGNLARALCLLSSGQGQEVPGIGAGITKSTRAWLGLEDGQVWSVVDGPLLADLLGFILELEDRWLVQGAKLYAALADWLGVPCTTHRGQGGWAAWAKEVEEENRV